jgi:hypothetical protein
VQLPAALDGSAATRSPLQHLIVATRGSSSLALLAVQLQPEEVVTVTAAGSVNLSEADDGHVSFSGLRLALSPCCRCDLGLGA